MALFYQQDINAQTKLGLWRIEESVDFFASQVPVQRDITHPHKRLQHLAGRFLLRHLFADFPMDLIRIADTRKPFVSDESFHFSISHCGAWAAAIASKTHRVGIDVEDSTPRVLRILDKFLHPQELMMLRLSQDAGSETGGPRRGELNQLKLELTATMLWSIKESVFKWDGDGGVDFSDMIRLDAMPLDVSGRVPGWFERTHRQDLVIDYRYLDRLCLSFVCTEV